MLTIYCNILQLWEPAQGGFVDVLLALLISRGCWSQLLDWYCHGNRAAAAVSATLKECSRLCHKWSHLNWPHFIRTSRLWASQFAVTATNQSSIILIDNMSSPCRKNRHWSHCRSVFTARGYAKRGICRRRVSVWLSVCLTPVLYQNG